MVTGKTRIRELDYQGELLHLMTYAIDAKCRTNTSYTWLRNSHLLLEHTNNSKPINRLVRSLTTSTSKNEEHYLRFLTDLEKSIIWSFSSGSIPFRTIGRWVQTL